MAAQTPESDSLDARDGRPLLAATVSPLVRSEPALPMRAALERLSRLGFRGAQLSASDPESRPRDLSASARRDLAATLARHELLCSGVDLFIPPDHFTDPVHAARAFDAAHAALVLAADLGRAPLVLPSLDEAPSIREALAVEATRRGVRLALLGGGPVAEPLSACIDCAASLAAGLRPDAEILALGPSLGAVRVVDLLRSGMRGPIGRRGESRLDVAALRVALGIGGFRGLPVVDARQWLAPLDGLAASIDCWNAHAP
ncbi:MAG: hypothetical protein RIS86_1377 [Planctomycetota bacterium]|jgi:sugar phosphate isomerase/epimerase